MVRNSDINRRSFLKDAGASAAGFALATGTVTARDHAGRTHGELMRNRSVREIQRAAGNPRFLSSQTKEFVSDVNTIVRTTVQTPYGELVHAEYDEPIDGEATGTYFQFDEAPENPKSAGPHRFREFAPEKDVMLLYEEGNIVARRKATDAEARAILKPIDQEKKEISIVVYDDSLGGFRGIIGTEEEARMFEISREEFNDGMKHPLTEEIQASSFSLPESPSSQFTTSSIEDCFWPFPPGPCILCAGGAGACGGGLVACVGTAGASCAPALLGCAVAGGACSCCLVCLDSWPPINVEKECLGHRNSRGSSAGWKVPIGIRSPGSGLRHS